MLIVPLILTPIFEKYFKKSNITKKVLKENIVRVLEKKHHKGEECLPNKDLGRALIFFKGRVEKKGISERFILIIHISETKVTPIFIATKTSRDGENITAEKDFYYRIAKACLSCKPKDCTSEPLTLNVERVDFGFGWTMPPRN